MMGELGRSLAGALRLAFLDKTAADRFPADRAGALRSFWAMLILLPGLAALDTVDRWMGHPIVLVGEAPTSTPMVPLTQAILSLLLAYIIGTLAYFLMVERLLHLQGNAAVFPRLVAGLNWSGVVALIVVLPLAALAHTGWLSTPMALAIVWVTYFWNLFYEAYVARAILGTGWITAAGFVMLDVITTELAFALVRGPLMAAVG
ncbi:hypothetical protein UCD39_18310 [Nitrospirillum sp. BR 11752]|uniref:hypothetical protein n=1 Tax=Nitrospirillum sp. BR 11752 TaxID=3104293 RepID=UPI002EC79F41|nr:hypothetical protein [Nitrospirillum sp. BR 11752]